MLFDLPDKIFRLEFILSFSPGYAFFDLHYQSDLIQKPWVYLSEFVNLVYRHIYYKRRSQVEYFLTANHRQIFLYLSPHLAVSVVVERMNRRFLKTAAPYFQRPQRFLERFTEVPAESHHFADSLHLYTETLIRLGEFFKVPARHLDNYIIERRLETCRSFTRDVVSYLIERVSDGELSGDLRYRKTGRLACERRTSRYPRIHFNDHHLTRPRMNGKLNIRPPGFYPYLSYKRN